MGYFCNFSLKSKIKSLFRNIRFQPWWGKLGSCHFPPYIKEKRWTKWELITFLEPSESRGGRTNYRPKPVEKEKNKRGWGQFILSRALKLQIDGKTSRLVLTDVRGWVQMSPGASAPAAPTLGSPRSSQWGAKKNPLVSPAGFSVALEVKSPPASTQDERDAGSIPGSGRSPGEGNGNSFQYSCLENPMDGGAWWATVHEVTESEWLSPNSQLLQGERTVTLLKWLRAFSITLLTLKGNRFSRDLSHLGWRGNCDYPAPSPCGPPPPPKRRKDAKKHSFRSQLRTQPHYKTGMWIKARLPPSWTLHSISKTPSW